MHTIGRYLSRTFVTKRSFAAIATGSLAIYSTVDANSHCDAAPVLRMKGGAILAADVGGTNSRLMLYKVLLSALSLSFCDIPPASLIHHSIYSFRLTMVPRLRRSKRLQEHSFSPRPMQISGD